MVDVQDLEPKHIGLKAFGLCRIPQIWTLPFFVVDGKSEPSEPAIEKGLHNLGLKKGQRIIIRSSGQNEDIESRGSLISKDCEMGEAYNTILNLREKIQELELSVEESNVNWIVQKYNPPAQRGHLSNERRLSEALRDWVVESEVTNSTSATISRIPIRKWRDSREIKSEPLRCQYKENCFEELKNVAKWAHIERWRVHFEWIWDGSTVYIVQADSCGSHSDGVDPSSLIAETEICDKGYSLKLVRRALKEDFRDYRKLKNAQIYRDFGYTAIDFFLLDSKHELESLFELGKLTTSFEEDLRELTRRPLVIRTDGRDIPESQKQMLPRSNELRSFASAKKWLIETFRNQILDLDLSEKSICLVMHHFIPSTSSAWTLAHPNKRKVRIESLWGLPEGVHWYAHDVFDVDTGVATTKGIDKPPKNLTFKERLRFKSRFIAPNSQGEWIFHRTAASHDWKRSITKSDWIREIAWNSRRIAEKLGKSVVVMWFVDVPSEISSDRVLPWFHEDWKSDGSPPKAAPRKKSNHSEEFTLNTKDDWKKLKNLCNSEKIVERVVIEPTEPDLVRDQKFAVALSELASEHGFIIELSGGLLSHAFYMLTSSGCQVECSDLFAIEEEELEFHKLVRDKIPQKINSQGEDVTLLKLEGEALITAIKRKIVEEALEIYDAVTTQTIIEEIADLQEIVNALTNTLSISNSDIETTRLSKLQKRGAFKEALMLEKTSLASTFDYEHLDSNDPFTSPKPYIQKTIGRTEHLPSYQHDIHSDKRHDAKGTFERQFSLTLPAYAENFDPPKTNFTLEGSDGSTHQYTLTLDMDRKGSDVRCKLRIISAPTQLTLF